ncbi:MAG: hypothetical protein FWE70_07820, partial [Oscillospiraceae bacterium]|nr:hypothetical protein [Oscillospiraceae bacterium]
MGEFTRGSSTGKGLAIILSVLMLIQICPLPAGAADPEPEPPESAGPDLGGDGGGSPPSAYFLSDMPEPCPAPAYCGEPECPCGEEGPEACVCDEGCACRTTVVTPCL